MEAGGMVGVEVSGLVGSSVDVISVDVGRVVLVSASVVASVVVGSSSVVVVSERFCKKRHR